MGIKLKEETEYNPYDKELILKTVSGEKIKVDLETAAGITWDLLDALNFSLDEMEEIADKIDSKLKERGCF